MSNSIDDDDGNTWEHDLQASSQCILLVLQWSFVLMSSCGCETLCTAAVRTKICDYSSIFWSFFLTYLFQLQLDLILKIFNWNFSESCHRLDVEGTESKSRSKLPSHLLIHNWELPLRWQIGNKLWKTCN